MTISITKELESFGVSIEENGKDLLMNKERVWNRTESDISEQALWAIRSTLLKIDTIYSRAWVLIDLSDAPQCNALYHIEGTTMLGQLSWGYV